MENKRIAIFYKSYLGSTKKYADWLMEELPADLYTYRDVSTELLKRYESIVVLSGTYAAQMPLIKFLKKYWNVLIGKNIVVVAVGIAPANDPQSTKSYERIPPEIKKNITYFKLPGKLFALAPAGTVSKEKLSPVIAIVKNYI